MYQKLTIVGRLGADAEMRYTPSGQAVANFSVATDRKWTGSDGQKHEETTWHRCALWGKLAESLTPYLVKGKQVLIEGRVIAEGFAGDDGKPRASLKVTVEEIRLLGGGNGNGRSEAEAPAGMTENEIPF